MFHKIMNPVNVTVIFECFWQKQGAMAPATPQIDIPYAALGSFARQI